MAFNDEILAAMKATYLAWVQAGCPQSYSINGRSVTKGDMDKLYVRLQELENNVTRQASGSFFLAEMQDTDNG